jgi:curved DNA-binding protein CbpA
MLAQVIALYIVMHRATVAGKQAGGLFDFKGYYAVLGFSKDERNSISSADIKVAYLEAAKRLHPDALAHMSAAERCKSAQTFHKLQEAYEVLQDAKKRKMYDAGSVAE